MIRSSSSDSETAEVIALKALAFLAEDPDRLGTFLSLTGLTIEEIRRNASSPRLLGGILEHLCSDESLLLVFAESAGVDPGLVARSAARLGGGVA
jgi:hypothetical protein